jgi:hypothetical protein
VCAKAEFDVHALRMGDSGQSSGRGEGTAVDAARRPVEDTASPGGKNTCAMPNLSRTPNNPVPKSDWVRNQTPPCQCRNHNTDRPQPKITHVAIETVSSEGVCRNGCWGFRIVKNARCREPTLGGLSTLKTFGSRTGHLVLLPCPIVHNARKRHAHGRFP